MKQLTLSISTILIFLLFNACNRQDSKDFREQDSNDSIQNVNINTRTIHHHDVLSLENQREEYEKTIDDAYKSIKMQLSSSNFEELNAEQKEILYNKFMIITSSQEHLNNYDSAEIIYIQTVQLFPEHKLKIKDYFESCMVKHGIYMEKLNKLNK